MGLRRGPDLTRRDLQAAAKAKGHPWDVAKGFDASAPISALRAVSDIGHPRAARLRLTVNGALRQEGDIADMLFGVADIVRELSKLFTLMPGDLVTPARPPAWPPCSAAMPSSPRWTAWASVAAASCESAARRPMAGPAAGYGASLRLRARASAGGSDGRARSIHGRRRRFGAAQRLRDQRLDQMRSRLRQRVLQRVAEVRGGVRAHRVHAHALRQTAEVQARRAEVELGAPLGPMRSAPTRSSSTLSTE